MYQVIARKYRPQTFSQVVNQEHVKQTLTNSIVQKRVGHGYIFSGPRGTGKTTLARIFAKSLNCTKGPTIEPCLVCASCEEIASGNALDLTEIDAASNRRIDDIRELRESVRYRPVRDRYKVFIIDEAHQITSDAFNALLKTLEEPPEWVVFILCTTEPQQFPATIVSRCQIFPFRTVETNQVVEHLKWLCQQEGITAEEEALVAIALAGDGSIRDSLSTLEQAIASFGTNLATEPVRDLLGAIPAALTNTITVALTERKPENMLAVVDQLYREGRHLQNFCGQLVTYFRNLLVMKISGKKTRLISLGADDREVLHSYLQHFNQDELTRYLTLSLDLYRDLQHAQHPRFRLEVGLLKLVVAGRVTPIEKVLTHWSGSPPENSCDGTGSEAPNIPDLDARTPALTNSHAVAHSNSSSLEKNADPQPSEVPSFVGNLVDTSSTSQPHITPLSSSDIKKSLVQSFRENDDDFTADALEQVEFNYSDGNLTMCPLPDDVATLQLNRKAVEVVVQGILGQNARVTLGEPGSSSDTDAGASKQIKRLGPDDRVSPQKATKPENARTELEQRALSNPEVQMFRDIFDGRIRDVRDLRSY